MRKGFEETILPALDVVGYAVVSFTQFRRTLAGGFLETQTRASGCRRWLNWGSILRFVGISRAREEGDDHSDLDPLVVSSDFQGMLLRACLETLGIAAARIWEPIEAIAASPEDLQQVEPADFLSEVLRTGKVVWEEG